ncbi:uncharacterized protein LOC129557180 [Moschus berezovskii]|uniref:uncharacterized protein LOC129557180 n=1 Tax=Moschus berezovskii TaxID=68408 RepID=UPI002443783E|nr:uncharacterized protein LOC129557180 [Moschus berezovskii]
MLEDSVSKVQGLRARALDLPRGTPGRRGAGRLRAPPALLVGGRRSRMRASGLACSGAGPCVGRGGALAGSAGSWPVLTARAPLLPSLRPAFRCEPLRLPRRGPRRPPEAGEGRLGIYTAGTGTEIRAQSADREGWAGVPHTVSTQVRSWNPIDAENPACPGAGRRNRVPYSQGLCASVRLTAVPGPRSPGLTRHCPELICSRQAPVLTGVPLTLCSSRLWLRDLDEIKETPTLLPGSCLDGRAGPTISQGLGFELLCVRIVLCSTAPRATVLPAEEEPCVLEKGEGQAQEAKGH